MPKIRTVTGFGDRIILANSSYIHTVSNIRIWVYEKILGSLELRLRYYNDLAKELSQTPLNASGTGEISFSPWYSENISAYWDSAGLPRVIPGVFFSPGLEQTQIPAVLSFVPSAKEPELFGWYLAIGESTDSAGPDRGFSIFIDPLKSAGTIYSRKGKKPEEKRLLLNCDLYINPGTNPPLARINRMLKPFIPEDKQNIEVRISFDGRTFEIREYPARHSNSLIFRGNL
jgi:hypothetical protein